MATLEQAGQVGWLGLAGVIFAAGMFFNHPIWADKVIAMALAVLLIRLAWRSTRSEAN